MPKKQIPGQQKLQIQTPPKPGTPAWLIQQIQTPTQTCRRETNYQPCPNCAAPTLYGYTTEPCAWPTRVDPINLTPTIQTMLDVAGRPLYQLTTNITGTAYQLINASGPCDALTVLTNHKCGYPPTGPNILTAPAPTYPPGSPAPF